MWDKIGYMEKLKKLPPEREKLKNIVTSQDELYKALVLQGKQTSQVKKIINYRKAASRYLKNIDAIGVLKSEKGRRENLYLNKELIEILKH